VVCTFWIVLMYWYQKWFLKNKKTSLACISAQKAIWKAPAITLPNTLEIHSLIYNGIMVLWLIEVFVDERSCVFEEKLCYFGSGKAFKMVKIIISENSFWNGKLKEVCWWWQLMFLGKAICYPFLEELDSVGPQHHPYNHMVSRNGSI